MKKRNAIVMGCMAVLGLSLLGSGNLNAAPAISFTDGSYGAPLGGYNLGYEFTVVSNISVTHLGYFDFESDGSSNSLLDPHPVGIFETAGQTLVVSNTVLTTDTLVLGDASNGYFVYHELPTPVTLMTGVTYRIVALTYHQDDLIFYSSITGLTVDPNLSLGPGVYLSGDSLGYPDESTVGTTYAAPNFLSEPVVAVPEPTSVVLMGSGILLLAARRRWSC